MSIFENINQFVEKQLEDFLRKHPHLELSALEEQLKEQERDTKNLITQFQLKEKQLQQEIIEIAEKIKIWHTRVGTAEAAARPDLAEAAKEREAALLRQGNQVWGKMEGVKKRIPQAEELLQQIQQRLKLVKAKYAEVKSASNDNPADRYTKGWNQGVNDNFVNSTIDDPLEAKFQQLELDEELESIKSNLNK
ncbi:MAG: TIGR04376 family protein [Xenococcus sp. (in: cyanobacteria)]